MNNRLPDSFKPTDISHLILDDQVPEMEKPIEKTQIKDKGLKINIKDIWEDLKGLPIKSFLTKKGFRTPRRRYGLATLLDFFLIALIIFYGINPAQRMIAPLWDSLQKMNFKHQISSTKEVFAFAPGLAHNKYDNIDFTNLNTLAFFDLPIDTDGDFNRDSRGFNSFMSDESKELFIKAHSYGTNVVLTATLTNNTLIKTFLDDPSLRQNFISKSLDVVDQAGIDGVALDFEYKGNISSDYQEKFSKFVGDLNNALHLQKTNGIVAVMIPSNESSNQLFNLNDLAKQSDKLFVMASDFIVPEERAGILTNPTYGYSQSDYFNNVSDHLSSLDINSEDKLSMERAWYGTGDEYPLYKPNLNPSFETAKEPASVSLDNDTIDRLVKSVPEDAQAAARKNIPLIGEALKEQGILDSNVLAYALATIEHETAGTFEPVKEIQGNLSARRYGYEGGTNYYGRGFIQLTHLRNYKVMGERIGMGDDLAKNPDLASDPKVAAKILAAFFKDNNVANLASQGSYVAARAPINPDYNGITVARLAYKYE